MATETLRPNAAGTHCNIPNEIGAACPDHWQNVDELVADSWTSVVYSIWSEPTKVDTYNIPDHSVGSGTINHVKVYIYIWTATAARARAVIYTHSTLYYGNYETNVGAWGQYTKQWNTNPNTGSAWTWAEIDALEIGVECDGNNSDAAYCTKVSVFVDYTVVSGWAGGDVNGVAVAAIGKVDGVALTAIKAINGVT